MPKWLQLPSDKLIHQPHQQAFLEARRKRICKDCRKPFIAKPPAGFCPTCNKKGLRVFDHLTEIAGRRFGKTRFGSIAGVEEATLGPSIGWACAPTNPKLHRYVIPAFQQLIPPDWVQSWNSEYLDLRLKNGSLIHFQTLEDPDQGRGQGLDWLWIDEVSELTTRHWKVISPSLADKQGVAFFTTSPRGHDWVYEELYRPALEGVEGFWALRAKTSDNPIFQTPEGKAYLERARDRMGDLMFRQEYEADFVTFEGAVYGNALDTQILRSADQIKQILPEWPDIASWRQVLVGLDTGADHPFGAVKLVSCEQGLVVVGEYLERNKSFIEHATSLKLLAGSWTTKWAINKNERQGSIELAQHGINCQKAENDVIAGIERVKSWLYAGQLFFAEPLCHKTVQQMKSYRWAENTSPRDEQKRAKEKVFKKEDELPDCLRYAVMTWPQLPKAAPVSTERDLSQMPEEMRGAILRMRRVDKEPVGPKESDVTGDFWL